MSEDESTTDSGGSTNDANAAELESLRAENGRLQELNELLTAVVTHCPAVVFVKDTEGRLQLCNKAYEELLGVEPGALLGKTDHEIFGPEAGAQNRENDLKVCERGVAQTIEEMIPHPSGTLVYSSIKFPLYNDDGVLNGLAGIATNITEQRSAEQERTALQEQIIEVQRRSLSELSTPIMPLADGVIALPIIGTIDTERAQRILESLLEGVGNAHTAILDITGVQVIDTHVAAAILRAARAARLLGARVIITGIQPDVAQALVGIGADWSDVETMGTLQDGVALALSGKR